MDLRVRVQRHLCIAHRLEDPGDWAFTICRAGLQQLVGARLKAGDTVDITVTGEVMDNEKRRSVTFGIALTDDPPRWAHGNVYTRCRPVTVSALQSLMDNEAVRTTYYAFLEALDDAASDLGLEAAKQSGADEAEVGKVAAYKHEQRRKRQKR